jgi:hypothetical protein
MIEGPHEQPWLTSTADWKTLVVGDEAGGGQAPQPASMAAWSGYRVTVPSMRPCGSSVGTKISLRFSSPRRARSIGR